MRRLLEGLRGEEREGATRGLALIRLAAIPVIFAGQRLIEHPSLASVPFDDVLAVTAVYALAAFGASFTRRGRAVPGFVYATLDLIAICALAYTSGGPFSEARFAFFFLPVCAAFLLVPAMTALASLVAVVAYVLISLPNPATAGTEHLEFVLTQALYVSWMGLAAVVLSVVLTRRSRRIDQLATLRGRLVAQALDAEDRERRRLAEALHDEAIQNLLAVRQELDDAEHGEPGSLERARMGLGRTVGQLRSAVFELHPYLLEHASLAAALRAVANQQGRRGRFRPRLRVMPDAAGAHDQLVLSLARELLANAATHARAREVTLALARVDGELVLEVGDDGRGIDPRQLARGPVNGHIGLASCAERVEALGGRFEVERRPEGGTTVRARIPAGSATGYRPADPSGDALT